MSSTRLPSSEIFLYWKFTRSGMSSDWFWPRSSQLILPEEVRSKIFLVVEEITSRNFSSGLETTFAVFIIDSESDWVLWFRLFTLSEVGIFSTTYSSELQGSNFLIYSLYYFICCSMIPEFIFVCSSELFCCGMIVNLDIMSSTGSYPLKIGWLDFADYSNSWTFSWLQVSAGSRTFDVVFESK